MEAKNKELYKGNPHHQKAGAMVAEELRRQIVTGILRPGDKLPSEKELQSQFEVSRPTLREALRLLEAESLITISRGQHGGARVTPLDVRVTTKQIGMYLQMSGTTLQDVWQARMALEPFAASLFAQKQDKAAIAALEATTQEAREAVEDPMEHSRLNAEFSTILCGSCGNKTIGLLASLIHEIVQTEYERATFSTMTNVNVRKIRHASVRAREKLVEYLRAGDASGAEKFWRDHIEAAAEVSLSPYQAQMPINVLRSDSIEEAT